MQGLRAWLALRSRRGQPAGAVQVAVYFTSLGGCPWPSAAASWCAAVLQLMGLAACCSACALPDVPYPTLPFP